MHGFKFTCLLSLLELPPALPTNKFCSLTKHHPLLPVGTDVTVSSSPCRGVDERRHARVWLARKTVHLKRVEVGLTSRVSELAERLAIAEDSRSVSTVLSEVGRRFVVYQ